jgi:hypothetical protein
MLCDAFKNIGIMAAEYGTMKQISEVVEKLFRSSLNICPEAFCLPPPHHHPISQRIRGSLRSLMILCKRYHSVRTTY